MKKEYDDALIQKYKGLFYKDDDEEIQNRNEFLRKKYILF